MEATILKGQSNISLIHSDMEQYTTKRYKIDIFEDYTFKYDSNDNANQYDNVYFDKSDFKYSTVIGIRIFQDDKLLKSAVIGSTGGKTGIGKNSIIIESERLLVCCSDTIFCLSIPDLTLLWRKQADQITCFEIFKYLDSYIIHGEVEISRLDKNGNILWQQSSADIFTTLEGKDNFFVTENYIIATDWKNRKYKFDFNGTILQTTEQKKKQLWKLWK
jgi:hypothetical protein